jgi:cytidylate kinase
MNDGQSQDSERLRVVSIDGPVASGKTVVGRVVAERLGWPMLDTGIMYRALTWAALERGVAIDDPAALTELAESVVLRVGKAAAKSVETAAIAVDGADATPHLRSKVVEDAVSDVAQVAGVRERMVEQQRQIAGDLEIVMVGRDIGTVVVPNARVKIYLDASEEVRAGRRGAQIREAGRAVADAEVLNDLKRRDAIDAGRATSPLRRAGGAAHIDTSEMGLERAIEVVMAIVRRGLGVTEAAEESQA